MLRRDRKAVLRIEEASFPFPWHEEDFVRILRSRGCVGVVAEREEAVAGFMIFERYRSRIVLLNLAVDPTVRRRGVGSKLIGYLASQLSSQRRRELLADVYERNLDAQLFFRALGFKARKIVRSPWGEVEDDAYRFVYRVGGRK